MTKIEWHKEFSPAETPTFAELPPIADSEPQWRIYQMSAQGNRFARGNNFTQGNRFLIIEEPENAKPFAPAQQQILAIAAWDKGWDQLLTTKSDPTGRALAMKVWNRDSSRAENCGNGALCLAALHMFRAQETNEALGVLHLTVSIASNSPLQTDCSVAPIANSRSESVVSRIAANAIKHELLAPNSPDLALIRSMIEGVHSAARVHYGNPHLVLFLDDSARPEKEALQGKELEQRLRASGIAFYRDGVNISFAQINRDENAIRELGRNIRQRIDLQVWERGAGLTDACGSGAAAVLYAACQQNLVADGLVPDGHMEIFNKSHIALKPLALEIDRFREIPWDMNAFRGVRGASGDFYLIGNALIEKAGVLHLEKDNAA